VARRLEGYTCRDEKNSTPEGKDQLMSQKGKRNAILELQDEPTRPLTGDTSANHAPSHDEIRRRAFEIYLERNGVGGSELDDWLQAEAELRGDSFVRRNTKETE
jgi:hypothetical protein